MFIDKYLLLRDKLKILSKLQAFAGNPLWCCLYELFGKMHIVLCKYYSKGDSRNAPKRLRKTVFRSETMDPET